MSAPVISFQSSASSLTKLDTSKQVVVKGLVQTQSSCVYQWGVNDSAVSLSTGAVSPVSEQLVAGSSGVEVSLVLSAVVLPMPSALQFTIEWWGIECLHCGHNQPSACAWIICDLSVLRRRADNAVLCIREWTDGQ